MADDPNPEKDIPQGLIHAFRQLGEKSVAVPRSIDNAILNAARRGLRQPAVRWWAVLNWPNWARIPGLAAAGLVLAFLGYFLMPSRFAREDVNRDRVVNILDAFQLARELRSGAPSPSGSDFNGDGIVDRADVDAIAAQAVRLEGSSRL